MGERPTARTGTQTASLLVGLSVACAHARRRDSRLYGRSRAAGPRRGDRTWRVRLATNHLVTRRSLSTFARGSFLGCSNHPRVLVPRAVAGRSRRLLETAPAHRVVLPLVHHAPVYC